MDEFDSFDTLDVELSAMAHHAYGRAVSSPRGLDVPEGRRSRPSYWVVCSPGESLPDSTEVLCVTGSRGDGSDDGDDENGGPGALAVFSFQEEEAEAFLRLRGRRLRGRGLRTRELEGGELISLLYGLWGGLSRVALDPVPEAEHQSVDSMVIVSREEFVKLLVSRVMVPAPRPLSGQPASRN